MQLSKQNKRTIDTLTPVVVAAGVGFVSFRKSKDWRFVVATIIIAWLIAYILTSQVTRFFYLKGPAELPTGAGAETYDALPLTTRLKDEIYSWGFRDDAPYQELLSLNDAQFIKVYNAWNANFYSKDSETLPVAIAGENSGMFTTFKSLQASLAARFTKLNLQ